MIDDQIEPFNVNPEENPEEPKEPLSHPVEPSRDDAPVDKNKDKEDEGFESINLLFGMVISPGRTLESIKSNNTAAYSIFIFMLAQASYIISKLLISGDRFSAVGLASAYIFIFLFIIVFWIILAGIYHFLSEILDGEGTSKSLFAMLGFSFAPALLLVPLTLIIKFFGWHESLIYCNSFLLLSVWTAVLAVKSIGCNYGISRSKSFLVFISPVFIMSAFGILFFAFIISILAIIF